MARLVGWVLLMLLVSAGLGASGKFQYKDPSMLFDMDLYRSTNARIYNRAVRGSHSVPVGFSNDGTDGLVWDGIRMALVFDGDGDRAVGVVDQIDSTGDYSIVISGVVADTTADKTLIVLYAGGNGGNVNTYSLFVRYSRTAPDRVRVSARTTGGAFYSVNFAADNQLLKHHYVLVKTSSALTTYFDGDSVASVAINAAQPGVIDSFAVGNRDLYALSASLVGSVSDTRIYNRALAKNERAALYRQYQQRGRPGYPIFERPRRRFGRN